MFQYYTLQDPYTPLGEGILDLYTYIMFYLVGVVVLTAGGKVPPTGEEEQRERLRSLEEAIRRARRRGEDVTHLEALLRELQQGLEKKLPPPTGGGGENDPEGDPNDPKKPKKGGWTWKSLGLILVTSFGAGCLMGYLWYNGTPPTPEQILTTRTTEELERLINDLIDHLSRPPPRE